MKLFTKEVKIGITAIAAVGFVFLGINFLKGINIFESSNTYYVKFKDCAGLQANNSVYANGYPVGVVRSINYCYSDNGGVVAAIELDKDMRLPVGTVAELDKGLMGGVTMSLVLGPNPADMLAPQDTITGGPHFGLMEQAGGMLPEVEALLPKIDSILANVNSLTGNEALVASIENLRTVTENLATVSAALPATIKKVDDTMANFNSVSRKVDDIDLAGTMGSVQSSLTEVQSTVQNLTAITGDLEKKLQSKDNTLGLLLNDNSLHENINHTVQSADSLLNDLKAHPKRYVHFSVFGKKDK